jgi:hypothetical protein
VKKSKFEKHLRSNGCYLCREGKKHEFWLNAENGKSSTVPRHPTLNFWLCQKICKDPGIPILKST